MDIAQLFSLAGKRALITGASQGIGNVLARGLRAAGAEIVLNGRDAGRLEAAAAEIGPDVRFLAFDVTDHAAARRAIDGFEEETGPIDILVNNAGMQYRAPLDSYPADMFQQLLQANIASVFNVGQAVARHMIPRGEGRIINIASVQSSLARQTIAPYTATKGAVASLTRGMAADWARHGLCCNALAPGYVRTAMNAALSADPAFNAWLEARTPAGRWGRAEELVGACVFLASPSASFINGHTLYVDGGLTVTV